MSPGRRWNSANGIDALAARPGHADDGLQGGQRDAHVRRVRRRCSARSCPGSRGMRLKPVDGRAARAGLALVARRGGVVEVAQRVRCMRLPPVVAMLRSCGRRPREDGLGQQRVAPLDLRVRRRRPCSSTSAPIRSPPSSRRLDLCEGRRLMSTSRAGPLDVLLHQVEQVRAAGDELGPARPRRSRGRRPPRRRPGCR